LFIANLIHDRHCAGRPSGGAAQGKKENGPAAFG